MNITRILGWALVIWAFLMAYWPAVVPSEFDNAPAWAIRIFASIIVLSGWLLIVVSIIMDKLHAMHRDLSERDKMQP